MSKVIVIGAGHGGLAAAARLKVKGHQVTVLNAFTEPSSLDQPLTLLGAYRDLFLKTGNALEDYLDLAEVETALSLKLIDGSTLSIPGSGIGRTLAQIENQLGHQAAKQWRDYVTTVGQLWLRIRQPLIENRLQSDSALLRSIGLTSVWQFRSYRRLQDKYLKNPDLLTLANAYRNQTNVSTDNDLGLISINAYVQENFGVYLPTGGLTELGKALQNRCLNLGVEIVANVQAKPIELDGQICGVETVSSKFFSADFVVVNDLTENIVNAKWFNLPKAETTVPNLYQIPERSWLGIGPAQAVLTGETVANRIGSAP